MTGRDYLKSILNLVIAVSLILFCVILLPKIFYFFMPFVIGWIISLIANPFVKWLEEKIKVKRKASSAFVIVLVLAAVIFAGYLIIAKLSQEAVGFAQSLPDIWGALEDDFKDIGHNLDILYRRLPPDMQTSVVEISNSVNDYFKNVMQSLSTPTMEAIGSIAKNIPSVIIGLIMTILSSYFFIAERNQVYDWILKYTSGTVRKNVKLIVNTFRTAIGGYFKAQFKIEIWIYILLVIGLSILHINYSLLIAVGIALLDILPFFGTGTVMIPWAIIKFLSGDYRMAIGLLITWGVGQLVRQLIQPKIVGDSMGMPPIPTLFLLFIGYKVGSVIGMIIAVPIGIILVDLNRAGLFDNTKKSLVLLVDGINNFRRLDDNSDRIKEESEDESNHL